MINLTNQKVIRKKQIIFPSINLSFELSTYPMFTLDFIESTYSQFIRTQLRTLSRTQRKAAGLLYLLSIISIIRSYYNCQISFFYSSCDCSVYFSVLSLLNRKSIENGTLSE